MSCLGMPEVGRKQDIRSIRAAQLTVDHTPDRPDEAARIQAANGSIQVSLNGELNAMCHACLT